MPGGERDVCSWSLAALRIARMRRSMQVSLQVLQATLNLFQSVLQSRPRPVSHDCRASCFHGFFLQQCDRY